MTLPVFTLSPGLAWSVEKEPKFSTRTQRSVSGRLLQLVDQPLPIWTFTLIFEFLRDTNDNRAPITVFNELRTQLGFFLMQQGQVGRFLFDDPTDDLTEVQIANGNGSTTAFQLVRNMGFPAYVGFNEPIISPNVINFVKINGVTQSPGTYSVDVNTGILTFSSPPGNTLPIVVNFSYYFRVRFADDALNFENFMVNLWKVKQLKLESVLL